MAWKLVTSIFLTSIVGAIFTIMYISSPMQNAVVEETDTLNVQSGDDGRRFLLQRNELSLKMNRLSKELGRKSCEILNLHYGKPVYHSGGWCEKNVSYGHQTDKQLAQALANFFMGKKVGSFGDGPGHYKAIIEASGLVQCYDAYDGGPYYEETTKGKVKYLDLSLPQFGLPLYDWIISLEVAEHIPQEHESTYLSNLVRHAAEGIVMSWAVPGQDGHYHINNRPFSYVVETMNNLGFAFSEKETLVLRQSATLGWLIDNTAVFRRKTDAKINMEDL